MNQTTAPTFNTYRVASRVTLECGTSFLTEDIVHWADSAETAKAKIEARGDHAVLSVSRING